MTITLSFRIASLAKPVMLIPTFVNGQGPYEFALDTGASVTVLSVDLAKNLGIEKGEVKQGLGTGGKVEVSMSQVDSLAIGAAQMEPLQVAMTDLTALSQATGVKLDGIIGYNYLKNFRVTIDYPQGKLYLE